MHDGINQDWRKKQVKLKNEKSEAEIIQQIEQLQQCIMSNSISSINSVTREYFPNKIAANSQQMVMVPKSKLFRLFEEIKLLKKAVTSQNKRISNQLESLKKGVRDINHERALLQRQQEYLKDMQRCASQGKIKFYKSSGNFYSPSPFR